ncbi:MAG TPA: copper resistance CopC family protein [Pseudonocardiaceae bacterium]|nr:copper resistance CopC family protein [Pseudonocardiaceae bacterium]
MSQDRSRLTTRIRILAVAIVSIVFVLVSAPYVSAHTALQATSPQDGSSIDRAPSQLLLEFTLPIQNIGYRVVVLGPDGHEYQAGNPTIVDNRLTQPLKPLGPVGDYRVGFRVVAADGHPQTFGIRFTLTKPGPAAGGASAVSAAGPALPPPDSAGAANNAPLWATLIAAVGALALMSGAVMIGRRVTHGLG